MKKLINLKFASFVVMFLFLSTKYYVLSTSGVFAQLSTSISPPITEITIAPGKETTQIFTITNDGVDGTATISIVPFNSIDELGNVGLDEKLGITNSPMFANWFSITSPTSIKFGEKFTVFGGQKLNIIVKFSPPKDVLEGDNYFTFLYEFEADGENSNDVVSTKTNTRIGSNILISISKDGQQQKTAEIVEFSVPLIIDSLSPLKFNVRIGNPGSYFFKPLGAISVKPYFGNKSTLNLAPLNIVKNSIRNIPCTNNEEIITCEYDNKIKIGIYKTTLKFSADNDGSNTTSEKITFAFPFSLTFVLLIIIGIYRKISHPIDKHY